MPYKLSLTDNKVARRIMVAFILAALIPTISVAVLSVQQLNVQLKEHVTSDLQKNSKDYALGLVSRLFQAQQYLELISSAVEHTPGGYQLKSIHFNRSTDTQFQFVSLSVITPQGKSFPLSGKASPSFTPQELKAIVSEKPLVKFTPCQNQGNLWMAIHLIENNPEAGILLGEIPAATIWEADIIEPNDLWIFGENNQLVFTTNKDCRAPFNTGTLVSENNKGVFSWEDQADSYLAGLWKIPTKGMFVAPDITVVLAQSETLAFKDIKLFANYLPYIALALMVVSLFITRIIIKYLSPLEKLKAATVRIANGDFGNHLEIKSKDEFEVLADSFNEMSNRLRNQFDIMSTMAEIDRQILSSLDAENIIDTVLNRIPLIMHCDLISIAHVNPNTFVASDIHTQMTKEGISFSHEPIKLGMYDILELHEKQHDVIEIENDEKFSAYTRTFGVYGDWHYLFIPVVVNGTLASIICLGYSMPTHITKESYSLARDIGDRIAVALSNAAWEEKLYQQAHYDPLTKLPNRLVLHDRLNQEMARAKRDHSQLAIFFIDLDRFKNINDSLGHAAGDQLLVQVSQIYKDCVRETDLVARLGGDEFVIVITDLHYHDEPMSHVISIAKKINKSLKKTLVVAGHSVTTTASIGIALFPQDADNVEDLLKNADAALYHAKNEGRANFRFYSREMNATALENIKLEQQLRQAIAKEELSVHFQPKVDISGQIISAEALVRWNHAEWGMISPGKFIPIAEQSGLIVEIGEWVLKQACLFIKMCQSQGIQPISISVNLSALEFKQPKLVPNIAAILTTTGVDPGLLEMEVTESVAMGDAKTCIDKMKALKNLGIKLSMDDFGTGYSSLSYLKELPLDILKIDQSFIRQLESQNSSKAIVKTIIALANGLAMKTVAEGVETQTQFDILKNYQCTYFQGYLFSKPLPTTDFLALIQETSVEQLTA